MVECAAREQGVGAEPPLAAECGPEGTWVLELPGVSGRMALVVGSSWALKAGADARGTCSSRPGRSDALHPHPNQAAMPESSASRCRFMAKSRRWHLLRDSLLQHPCSDSERLAEIAFIRGHAECQGWFLGCLILKSAFEFSRSVTPN